MKVILTTDVKKVGRRGELITVADGYAMNVLFPKKLALPGTPENLKRYEVGKQQEMQASLNVEARARATMAALNGTTLTITAKASPTGTLFKSIHEADIAAALQKIGHAVPASAVVLTAPIKKIGTTEVTIVLQQQRGAFQLIVA